MTLKSFKGTILKRLPAKWSRHKRASEAFDACLECFEPTYPEACCNRVGERAFPWMLLVSVLIELLKWWLENRNPEQRNLFRRWQKETRALNGQA